MSKKNVKQKREAAEGVTVPAAKPNLPYSEGEVAAKAQSNVETYVRFNTFHSLHLRVGRLLVSAALCLLLGAWALFVLEQTAFGIVLFVIAPITPFLFLWLQAASVRARLKKDAAFCATVRTFEIDDEKMTVTIKSGKSVVKFAYALDRLWRVYETKACFYVYCNDKDVYAIEKNSIIFGSEERLREIFSALGKDVFRLTAEAKRG